MSEEKRFFVDLRIGCGAVRDRQHPGYDAEYHGLHSDTPDVVAYRAGYLANDNWYVDEYDKQYLRGRCDELNAAECNEKNGAEQ